MNQGISDRLTDYANEIIAYANKMKDSGRFHELPLRAFVTKWQQFPAYTELLNECRKVKLDFHDWNLNTFFQRCGFYFKVIIDGYNQGTLSAELERYLTMINFPASIVLPLPWMSFSEPNLDFGHWSIRRLTSEEIDQQINTPINETFYPAVTCDSYNAAQLHYIWLEGTREPRKSFDFSSLDLSGKVDWQADRLPIELQVPIRSIICFRWEDTHRRDWLIAPIDYSGKISGHEWFSFETVEARIHHNYLLEPPTPAFAISQSWFENDFDPEGEYIGDRLMTPYYLGVEDCSEFVRFVKTMEADIRQLHAHQDHCAFVLRALDYFVRASFTNGLEQLIWHITTLEILLTPDGKEQISETVARRSALIVGATPAERTAIKKHVKDLYNLRSKVVHGGEFTKNRPNQSHLWLARSIARRVLTWAVGYYAQSARNNRANVLNREGLLDAIDFDRTGLPDSPL